VIGPVDAAPPRARAWPRLWSGDLVLWWLAAAATIVSIGALVYVDRDGDLLAYFDANAHLDIARRVIDNSGGAFSLAQLGGVWLPLPHLLALPFVWNDDLYFSGLAGSFASMAAFVVCCVFLYLIVVDLTGSKLGGALAAVAFGLNLNVLYMQAVPMTELLLCAAIAALAYFLQRWIRTDRWGYLLAAGVAADLGCATRYEAWVVTAAAIGVVAIVLVAKRTPLREGLDVLLAFALFACVSIGLWVAWNQLIFADALNFQTGDYAKASNWIGSYDVAVGHPARAAEVYGRATLEIIGPFVLGLGAIGLLGALLLRRTRLAILPALSSLVLVPFFVYAIQAGQRPMRIPPLDAEPYNVRFALTLIIPAAIGVGCFVGLLRPGQRVVAALAALVAVGATAVLEAGDHGPILAYEPTAWNNPAQTHQVEGPAPFLRAHYDGGRILAGYYGNELVLSRARITPGHDIDEGSYREWGPALHDPPSRDVRWIVMRMDAADPVNARLTGSRVLAREYRLVYDHLGYRIYRRR
jgi:hypothetical protein